MKYEFINPEIKNMNEANASIPGPYQPLGGIHQPIFPPALGTVQYTPLHGVSVTFPLSKENSVEIKLTKTLTVEERELLIQVIHLLPAEVRE